MRSSLHLEEEVACLKTFWEDDVEGFMNRCAQTWCATFFCHVGEHQGGKDVGMRCQFHYSDMMVSVFSKIFQNL